MDLGVICETLLGNDMAVESKFAPTYNMTLNLLRRHTPSQAEELLEQSFGQYQRIRALDNLRERRPNLQSRLEDLRRRRFRHPKVPCTERTLSQFLGARQALEQARVESSPGSAAPAFFGTAGGDASATAPRTRREARLEAAAGPDHPAGGTTPQLLPLSQLPDPARPPGQPAGGPGD